MWNENIASRQDFTVLYGSVLLAHETSNTYIIFIAFDTRRLDYAFALKPQPNNVVYRFFVIRHPRPVPMRSSFARRLMYGEFDGAAFDGRHN